MYKWIYRFHDGSHGEVWADRYETVGRAYVFYEGAIVRRTVPIDWLEAEPEKAK